MMNLMTYSATLYTCLGMIGLAMTKPGEINPSAARLLTVAFSVAVSGWTVILFGLAP